MVNTTSEEISDVAIEASVWDLEGASPYNEIFDKLTIPSKQTLPISEMKYPKSENPKPVYFLLLKLYRLSDHKILSRNFYWLHLPGGDYKLLKPCKKTKTPLKITSLTFIRGCSYEVKMQIENTSKKAAPRSVMYNNNLFTTTEFEAQTSAAAKCMHENGGKLFQKIRNNLSSKNSCKKVTETSGSDVGVAFFLCFSVHASKEDVNHGADTRILPVHYSDNYLSLVPGEVMNVSLKFEVAEGITPRVKLHGWNYDEGHMLL